VFNILSLTNGEKANAFTEDVIVNITLFLTELEAAPGNAALLITSTDPKFWSNGINLEWLISKRPTISPVCLSAG